MSGLEIDWPDEGAERVRATRGRLIAAGVGLRAMRFEDRLHVVHDVLGAWTAPDSPWRRELAQALSTASTFSTATIREGLDSALRAWRPADFVACAEREIGAQLTSGGTTARALAPFESTLVVAGGAIPMPTLLTSLIPLVLGSPVMLRETRHDPVTPGLLARSIAERDPEFARALEPVRIPVEDVDAYRTALEADCVVATGSDESLAAIRDRLSSRTRFVGFGHRFSIGVVGPEIGATDEALAETARGFALDVARWDQSGCLSPVVIYLVDVPVDTAKRLTRAIANALESLDREMPRGSIDPARSIDATNERSSARMRSGVDEVLIVEGDGHTIILEMDATPRPAPLGRFLRLHPVESPAALERVLRPFHGHLSNAAIAGFPPSKPTSGDDRGRTSPPNTKDRAIVELLVRAGVSRVTSPGAMQTPEVDWPHDGLPLFGALARFVTDPLVRTREILADGHLESDH